MKLKRGERKINRKEKETLIGELTRIRKNKEKQMLKREKEKETE